MLHNTFLEGRGNPMVKEKVILAYSGGLDTSVAITWLKKDYDVIAVCMDVGEGKDLSFIHDKALNVGAIESHVIDVKDEFAEDYVLVALQGHTFYEQKYPLVSALLIRQERQPLRMAVLEKAMTKFVLSSLLPLWIHLSRWLPLYGSGSGRGKRKSPMQKRTMFRFLLIWIHLIR